MLASPCHIELDDRVEDVRVGAAAGIAVDVTDFWLP
jgi:hypothetical protein